MHEEGQEEDIEREKKKVSDKKKWCK